MNTSHLHGWLTSLDYVLTVLVVLQLSENIICKAVCHEASWNAAVLMAATFPDKLGLSFYCHEGSAVLTSILLPMWGLCIGLSYEDGMGMAKFSLDSFYISKKAYLYIKHWKRKQKLKRINYHCLNKKNFMWQRGEE